MIVKETIIKIPLGHAICTSKSIATLFHASFFLLAVVTCRLQNSSTREHYKTTEKERERYKSTDDETAMKRPNRNQIKFSSVTSRRTSETWLWRVVHVFREETKHVAPIPEIPRNMRLNKFSAGKERYYVKDRLTGASG